jgi:DNA-binding transcriptional MerR regulator
LPPSYTISDLSREFDVTTRTIRFYEAEGLLAPERQGQARIYTERDRVLLKLILRGKRLGFSLAESRQIISLYNPATGNREQLQLLMNKISERQEQLKQQMTDIRLMQKELEEAGARCQKALDCYPAQRT